MLIIRKSQMTELRRNSRDEYFDKVAHHLRKHCAEAVRELDDAQLRQYVERNWPVATEYGLCSELAGCVYLEATCCFGEDFHGRNPWSAILSDEDASEHQKMVAINDRMIALRDAQRA